MCSQNRSVAGDSVRPVRVTMPTFLCMRGFVNRRATRLV
jgi:hypothetical protein